MALNQTILPEFDHEMANTRKSLERVPDNKLGWKPHVKSMTLGGLATHLATINLWVDATLGLDSFDVGSAPPQPELKSRQEILSTFYKNTASALNAIPATSHHHLLHPCTPLS